MPRTIRNDNSSQLKAHPDLQSLNRDSTGRIFEDMTNMHDIVKKGIGLKERTISTVVFLAATITGLVIGGKLLALGGGAMIIASGASLVAMSSFMAMYTGYSLVNTIMRVLNRDNIKDIEKAAAHSKLSQIIEEEQEEEMTPVARGGRRIHLAPSRQPVGAFRF